VKAEPAGDLVDLIASGAIEREQDKPLKVLHCSICGKKGVTARTHESGHQQSYRHVRK